MYLSKYECNYSEFLKESSQREELAAWPLMMHSILQVNLRKAGVEKSYGCSFSVTHIEQNRQGYKCRLEHNSQIVKEALSMQTTIKKLLAQHHSNKQNYIIKDATFSSYLLAIVTNS